MSYTSRVNRDALRPRTIGSVLGSDWVLGAVTLVSMCAILLCYNGRLRAFRAGEGVPASGGPANLSTVTSASELEPAMRLVFDAPADRTLAARVLLESLSVDGVRTPLPNVGSIARFDVPAAAIDAGARLSVYDTRLREARARAKEAGRPAPASVPLFTSADVVAIKPGLAVRTEEDYARAVFWCAVSFLAAFHLVALVWRLRGVPGDRVLFAAAHLVAALGFVVALSRPDPLRDTLLLVRFTEGALVALAVFLAASLIDIRAVAGLQLSYLPLGAAFLLSTALILFGSGPGSSDARINLGPVQPTEAIRLLLAFFLAGYFARRWELIRQLRGTTFRTTRLPSWLNVPRLDHVLPVLVGVGVALVLFFAQKDLGPALLLSVIFLSMFAVARGGAGIAVAGLAVLIAGFYAGHLLGVSSTLSARIAMWGSPWENSVRGGDQVAQALWAMATGGGTGTGLGLGAIRYVPAGHTDLVLASVAEELGVVGVLTAALAFVVIAWRGLRIARSAETDYGFFLALAMTLSIVAPFIVMCAGVLGVIPLTGIATPFLSYGGSAMAASFFALGLLVAIGRLHGGATRDGRPFVVPVRWTGRVLVAAAVVLVAVWARVQIVQADEFLVRPQLGRQADGGLRYQYNPRVLDAARSIPRGSVLDRAGVPLASDDAKLIADAMPIFSRMGLGGAGLCSAAGERCYPLGGAAFHILGDADTRINWAASNSSYVERDEESNLRGFDDRGTMVRVRGTDGTTSSALRRDYASIVPLVRHRWNPGHPDVAAILSRPRDVRLTIDARLQYQTAAILGRAARAAGVKRAAAVVLDAATGEVLANVSYPWPDRLGSSDAQSDAMLDRARYGLYPPGSTFKLVTAAAALRLDPGLTAFTVECSRLADGRVGARIPGYTRPVRDDVKDSHPHGTISMHDGMVRSCNAYFAQLAVRIGPDALAETSNLAGISAFASTEPARMRDTLPHAGYGQGEVLTTPLRMARVAAAIGSDGTIRETPIVKSAGNGIETPFLSPAAARTLGGYMRDAVTAGTGRVVAANPARVAGKTGTAEVDGAASHAWFVGHAPHGTATRRIAFAVIFENAGYGGATAASAAGQIVSAAASLGLIR